MSKQIASEAAARVLVGAETYIAGPYHFEKNIPQLVRGVHVAYIDSIKTPSGEPMFSEVEELEFIDGEEDADDLEAVGLTESEEQDEPAAHTQHEAPALSEEEQAAVDAMKSGETDAEGEGDADADASDSAEASEAEEPKAEEPKAASKTKAGRQLNVGRAAPKPDDSTIVTV